MVIDHAGDYFFPGLPVFRALGRLSFPVWLFLIGYARSRKLDRPLIISAVFLSVLDYCMHWSLQTFHILWTIILVRLVLNRLMQLIGQSEIKLALVTMALLAMAPLTSLYIDYGSFALIMAMSGYLVRHGFRNQPAAPLFYLGAVLVLYSALETIHFQFPLSLQPILWIGSILLWLGLGIYLPRHQTEALPDTAGNKIISLFSRHTLAFYVLHLVVIDAILLYTR